MRFSPTCNLAAAILFATLTATAYAADKPSDAQIAHIAYTAGDLDVKAGKVALEKSKNAEVRAFARSSRRSSSRRATRATTSARGTCRWISATGRRL
jgi:putative membrane protein